MATTEYNGFLIETYESAGEWHAQIRRPGNVPIKAGGDPFSFWQVPEPCDSEQQAIDLAKRHIDAGTVF